MILKKIKEYSKILMLAMIVITLVIGFGCSSHSLLKYDNEDQSFVYEKGYGSLKINIPTVRGWTVAQYDVTATKSGETTVTASTTTNNVSLRLKIGTWTISVVGKDSFSNTIYQGVASANVTETGNSVTIGLLKKAGNYKLTLNSTYPVVSGQPGFIEKIVVTASRGQGFMDVVMETNTFANSLIFSGLAQGDWTFTAKGYAAELDSDYQPTGNEVLYLEDSYTLTVVASKITASTQNLNTQKRVTPVKFSHLAGTYSGAINVTLTCDTVGATIYYTTNGTTPTTSSSAYSSAIPISSTKTLKVMAAKTGVTSNSIVGSRLYTIDAGVTSVPQMSPVGGTYSSDQSVTLTCADSGAVIYYTVDGSTPTTSSTQYSTPIAVAGNGVSRTIKAIAVAAPKTVSGVSSQTYTISYSASSAPTFTPASGSLTTNDNITMECGTAGASIYYTTDGSNPKTSGTKILYTSSFSLAVGTYTINAYSTAAGFADSSITSGLFTVTEPQQDNSIIFATAENIISGEEWNPSSLIAGINWFGVDIFETGTFKIEWSETYSGSVTMYENDLTEADTLTLTGTGNSRTVSLVSGARYFLKFNSTYEMASFSVRIYLETSGGEGDLGSNYPSSGSYSPVNMASWGTATWKLGANYVSSAPSDLEIAVYASNASKVLLEIYSAKTGADAQYDYWMAKGSDGVWRAKIAGVPNYALYAFRAWGPNWSYDSNWTRGNSASGFASDVDTNGNRYNPNKVLYDPYAKEISHDKETPEMSAAGESGGMYGTGGLTDLTPHGYNGPCTGNVAIDRRNVDTGKWAPKSVAIYNTTSFGTKPAVAEKDGIIYEAHVRGLTQHSSSISLPTILNGIAGIDTSAWGTWFTDAERGTYKAAGKMAKYLKALGYTTIELLPIHETANDINPADGPGGNYWGYMTYGYFAPDRRYAYDKTFGGPTKEFKEMCAAFHAEGLEVYLDVVYNHTGEGGNWDPKYTTYPTLNPNYTTKCKEITSFAGLDNANYYALVADNKGEYWETTGCGNNMDASKAVVREFVKDSLKYWITEMGVDGFRFDLAPVLGRDAAPNYYFNANGQLLTEIAAMTTTYNVEMVAEAWDCQWPGGYQVSNFPSGWGEWNGFYRDSVRKFIKGGGNKTSGYPSFTDVFNGSYGPLDRSSGNIHTGFNDNGGPQKSVNFIVAHDGFTLMDLVSYDSKQNTTLSWPFGPSDGGSSDNDSWSTNSDPALRRQQLRNLWTILMFSRGVPMTVWGDEFARTQNGNNNPYNVDSICSYNNYNMINTDSPNGVSTGSVVPYHNNFGTDTKLDNANTLFKFARNVIQLRRNSSALKHSSYDMTYTYKREDGVSDIQDGNQCVWIRIDGSSTTGGSDYLLLINTYSAQISYTVPAADAGKKWVRIIDTASWAEANDNYWPAASGATITTAYGVNAYSIVVLQEVAQ